MTVDQDRLTVTQHTGATRSIEMPAEDAHERMWRTLAQCIAERREPAYTPARALSDLSTLFGVERAIKTGDKIYLEE